MVVVLLLLPQHVAVWLQCQHCERSCLCFRWSAAHFTATTATLVRIPSQTTSYVITPTQQRRDTHTTSLERSEIWPRTRCLSDCTCPQRLCCMSRPLNCTNKHIVRCKVLALGCRAGEGATQTADCGFPQPSSFSATLSLPSHPNAFSPIFT